MENLLSNERFNSVSENYKVIINNISNAAAKSGRDVKDITLLAATKTVPTEIINYAINLGVKCIGENRVQEFLSKYSDLNLNNVNTHFIGHLQTNKVKQIISKVDMIESVDSLKLAKEISLHSVRENVKTNILIEVNIGREENKSGVYIENLIELLKNIANLDNINVKGLMAIPPKCDNNKDLQEYFSKMHEIFVDIRDKSIDNISMDVLSMGMSNDYIEAIIHGANIIRIGSALFGNRKYK